MPPLYIQLTQLGWSSAIDQHLRYFANTGGRMPRTTLDALRARVPSAKPFLMYGLTGSLPFDLPAARGSGPPTGLHRQGDPERRDPGAA